MDLGEVSPIKSGSGESDYLSKTVFQGGRLRNFVQEWRTAGAPQGILKTILGHAIPFVRQPPLVMFSKRILRRFAFSGMEAEIASLRQQGVLEPSVHPSGFLSQMFPVSKPDGGLRPILNLKRLNAFLSPKKFRLLNHQKVPYFLQKGDYLAKLDLHQAYFHIPIRPSHRRFLSVVHRGQVLQMTSLPFGLSTAPVTFARLSNWMAAVLRDRGIRVIVYLDDFLLASQSRDTLKMQMAQSISFLQGLGWVINFEKSSIEPQTACEFLGLRWDTANNRVSLPLRKVASLSKDLAKIIRTRRWSWRSAKRVMGKMSFAGFSVPLGRLRSRTIQRGARYLPELLPRKSFPVPVGALKDMQWWLGNIHRASAIFQEAPSIFLVTDASDTGWGAHAGNHFVQGSWDASQKRMHVNLKEMYAVCLAVESLYPLLVGKSVLLQSDNRSVVSYIRNQGGTRSKKMTEAVKTLFSLAQRIGFVLTAHYIPGPLNEVADSLSRKKSIADWSLSRSVALKIFKKWGRPYIDLFASASAKVVKRYVSRDAKDSHAAFTDAFSRVWDFPLAWVFPPPSLIPRVLSHLNTAKGVFILIVPRWEKVFWRADLRNRAIAPPFQIRNLQHHLLNARTGRPLPQARKISLEAWRVRGGPISPGIG